MLRVGLGIQTQSCMAEKLSLHPLSCTLHAAQWVCLDRKAVSWGADPMGY